MGKLFKHAPSPAMVVAVIAVVLALGGTAVAALSGKDKKKVRNIADQEITKKAPGLAVASAGTAANASNASNAADAAKLGGVAPSGYQQGGGHTYFGAKSAAAPSTGNALLSIPGIANITVDCAANGVDSTVHITNTSGVNLGDVGQNQASAGATLNPFGPGINNGATVDINHVNSSGNGVADTVLMLWSDPANKVASIHISNVFCNYGATATTNQ
jgi:hypothetical protein